MPNRRKDERNAEIVRLFDNGKGLLQREIADQFHMNESAVSMVIIRDRDRKRKQVNCPDYSESRDDNGMPTQAACHYNGYSSPCIPTACPKERMKKEQPK